MAALPPNSTERWWLDYQTAQGKHALLMRTEDGTTSVDATASFVALLEAAAPGIAELVVIGMRRAATGSNITVPVAWLAGTDYGDLGAQPAIARPAFLSMTGRTTGGHRAELQLYALAGVTQSDFRLQPGESGIVDDMFDVLSAAEGTWLAIDGLAPFWNRYVNVALSAYYQRKARVS